MTTDVPLTPAPSRPRRAKRAPISADTGPARLVKSRLTRLPGAVRYAWGQLRRRIWVPVTITGPPSDALVDWNVEVPMRDGVLLRVNVFRPDDAQRHPVLLS